MSTSQHAELQPALAPKTRTPRASTARKRDEIIRAATEVFGNKGYFNGTLADIADQVGLTHAGILHHFGSKENLLLEVLKRRDDSDVWDFEDHVMPIGPETFEHLVYTAVLNSQRPGIVQVFAVLSAESVTDDHPAKTHFQERYEWLRGALVQAFQVMYGEPTPAQAEAIKNSSASILAAMDGLQLQWLLAPEAIDLGAMTDFAVKSLVEAVRRA